MKHKKSDDPKLPACLTVALCLLLALLVCCAKSDDRPQPQTADPGTKEDKPQIAASQSLPREKKVQASQQKKTVLTSPLAQMGWYPAQARALRRQIGGFFEKAVVAQKNNVIALILPHAGYRYSGQTAAFGLRAPARQYKRIVVIGPSHRVNMPGVLSVPSATHYSTPLGEVPLDTHFIEKLKTNPMFQNVSGAHQNEHSVQIEVPLLQYAQPNFKLVPIVAGQCSPAQIKRAADTLLSLVDSDTLVVASSDFVHYGSNYGYTPFGENIPEQIKKLDMGAYEHIANLDSKGFLEYKRKTGATICGYIPVAILLAMVAEPTETELMQYATSGELMGDFTNSVSYLSVAFTGKWQKADKTGQDEQTERLSDSDKDELLKLARLSLEFYLKEKKIPRPSDLAVELTGPMKRRGAAFVTLKKHRRLRGCIGDILPRGPLYESVIRNAVNAGFNDYRFPPVTDAESGELVFEISALSVPKPVTSPDQIRIGTEGVILKKQGRSAVYLPQVAPEQGWNVDQMLSHLSTKADLPADAWKQDAMFLVFQADVFGEHE
jgi:AmmeMemoRadiSam system protein B/AmmeMemoRadiSam system protein A